jgi:diguanylate cyclase (GGDEF)-like protein/PAS domain S-box-containing protein
VKTHLTTLDAAEFARATFDAVSAHVCVLDSSGRILAVNRAWREFATANPPVPTERWEGVDYLAVCDVATGPGADGAAAFAAGVRQVLAGERREFSLEYPCHSSGEKRWFVARVTSFEGPGPARLAVWHESITARKLAEEYLRLNERRLTSLLHLHSMAPDLSENELIQAALDEACRLTGSRIGYLHFVNDDQETIALKTWSTETLKSCTAVYEQHYPLSRAGVWADCARRREPVIHNDYPNLPEKRGLPEGHSELLRHMAVPYAEGEKIRAIMGVGNKGSDYDETDVRVLQILVGEVWRIAERKRTELQLAKLSRAVQQSPAAIVITDVQGTIEHVNPKFVELTGYSLAEAVGQNPRLLKSGVQPPEYYREMWHTITAGREWRGEFCNRKKNGELYWESASISPITDAAGRITHFVAVKEDVTESKRRQQALLRQMKELEVLHALAVLGTEALDPHILLRRTTEIVAAELFPECFAVGLLDESGERLGVALEPGGEVRELGAREGVVGRVLATASSTRIADVTETEEGLGLRANMRSLLCAPLRVGTRVIGIVVAQSAAPDAFGETDERLLVTLSGQLATAIDSAQLFTQAQHLARTDPLTGLFNRRHLLEIAERDVELARRHKHPLATLMIDIDHFKAVNDTYGHATGDEVLCAVATRLRGSLRTSDIFGRVGGEEFVAVLPETEAEQARIVAERVRCAVGNEPVHTKAGEIGVTASVGLATLTDRNGDAPSILDSLLKSADEALLEAKRAGRNRVRVSGA